MTELRDAEVGDLDAVAALDAMLFGSSCWSHDAMRTEFEALGDTRTIIVAVSGDGMCGYGILLIVGDGADLQRVGVAHARQRNGVGTRLVAALVERAERARCRQVMLEVAADNAPAISLYGRLGFVELSRRPAYYPDGVDAVVMRRERSS